MLIPYDEGAHFFEGENCQFIVVAASGNQLGRGAELKATNLLIMGLISHNFSLLSEILNADKAVSAPSANQVLRATERSYSSIMQSLEFRHLFIFEDVENLDLPICESGANFGSMPHKRNRANVISRVFLFEDLLDFASASRPNV